ncbi:MAG: hypothetical protein JWO69_1767, partial [Thermoleophilia bacterium]|nr:hypothetical protein [Thermoleophilia bacterium]
SGLAKERAENSYSYTGMRKNAVGGTTHHHARDYRADIRGWLQTDQYMDPWSDLGLSMSPDTRDRHSYAVSNPVSFVDTNGHNCSSGTGTTGGGACADAWNNHCKKNPGSMYCPKGQKASGSQMEANDQRVIAATGGSPNYVTPGGQPHYMPAVVSTVKRGPAITSLKNPVTNFMIGDQVACGKNPSWGGCAWAGVSLFKPAKFGELAYDAKRGADLLDNAGDAKRATSGMSRMDTFRRMADEGIDGYTVNPHVLNSLRKSGRRHITPDDFRAALGTTPVAGTPGSMIFANPSTGTQVIVNSDKVIVGVWPKGFR